MLDGDDYFYSREESTGSTHTAASSTTGRRGRGGGRGRGRGGRSRGRGAGTSSLDATPTDARESQEVSPPRRGRGGSRGRGGGRGRAASSSASAGVSLSRASTPLSLPVPPADGMPVKRKRGRPPKNPPSLPASATGSPMAAVPFPSATRRRLAATSSSATRGTPGRSASASADARVANTGATLGAGVGADGSLEALQPPPVHDSPATPTLATLRTGSAAPREASVISSGSSLTTGPASVSNTQGGRISPAPNVAAAVAAADEVHHSSGTRLRRRLEGLDDESSSLHSRRTPTDTPSGGGHGVKLSTHAALNSARAAASARQETHDLLRQAQVQREERLARLRDRLQWDVKRFRTSDGEQETDRHSPALSALSRFETQLYESEGCYTLRYSSTQTAGTYSTTTTASSSVTAGAVADGTRPVASREDACVVVPLAHGTDGGGGGGGVRPRLAPLLCPLNRQTSWPTHDDNKARARDQDAYVGALLQRAGVVDHTGTLLDDHAGLAAPSVGANAATWSLERLVQEAASHVSSTTSSYLMTGWERYVLEATQPHSRSSSSGGGGSAEVSGTLANGTPLAGAFTVSPLLMDSLACHAQPHLCLYGPHLPRSGSFSAAARCWRAQRQATSRAGSRAVKLERTHGEEANEHTRGDTSDVSLEQRQHTPWSSSQFVRHAEQHVVLPIIVGSYAQLVDANSRDKSHIWTVYVRGLFDGHPGTVAAATESRGRGDVTNVDDDVDDTAASGQHGTSNPNSHSHRNELEENYLAQFIDHVTFVLDKSFTPCVRTVYQPPYEVTEHGWGEFVVSIHVHLRYQGYLQTAAARELRHEMRHFAFSSHGRAVLQRSTPMTSGRALFDPVTNSQTLLGSATSTTATTSTTDGTDPNASSTPGSLVTPGDARPATPTSPTAPLNGGESASSTATGVGGASGGGNQRGTVASAHTDTRSQSFAQQLLDVNHTSGIRPLVYRGPLLPPHLQSCDSDASGSDDDAPEKLPQPPPPAEADEEAMPIVKIEKDSSTGGESKAGVGHGRRRRGGGGAWLSEMCHSGAHAAGDSLTLDDDDETGLLLHRGASSATLNADEEGDEVGSETFPASPQTAAMGSGGSEEATLSGAMNVTTTTTGRPTSGAAPPPPRRGPGRPAPSEAARRTRMRKAVAYAVARADAARQLEGSVKDTNVVILTHALRFSHRTTLPAGIPPTGDFRTDGARREQYAGYVLVPEPVVTEQYDEIVIPLIHTDTSCSHHTVNEEDEGETCWYATSNAADQHLLLAASALETSCRRVLHHYLRDRGLAREQQRAASASAAGSAAAVGPANHWSGVHKKTGGYGGGRGGTATGAAGGTSHSDSPPCRGGPVAAPASLARAVAQLGEHAGAVSCWSFITADGDAATRDALLTGSYLTSVAATARADGWLGHSLAANHAYWFASEGEENNDSNSVKRESVACPVAAVITVGETPTQDATHAAAYRTGAKAPLPYLLTSLEFDLLSLLLLMPVMSPGWDADAALEQCAGAQGSTTALSLLTSTILSQLVCVASVGASGGGVGAGASSSTSSTSTSRTVTTPTAPVARCQSLLLGTNHSAREVGDVAAAVRPSAAPLPDIKATLHTPDATPRSEPGLLCHPRWRPSEMPPVSALAAITSAPPIASHHPNATTGLTGAAATAARHGANTAGGAAVFTSGQLCGLFGAHKDVQRLQAHRDALLRAIDEMRLEMAQRQAIEVFKRL